MTALPHLAILLATVLWTSSFATGKLAILAMTASQLLVMRFGLGALILFAVIQLTRQRSGPTEVNRQAFFAGMIAPGAATLLSYWGMLHTTSINAVVIFALVPLVTSLYAWWLISEKPSQSVLIGSGIALSGTAVLISDDLAVGSSSLFGDFLFFLNLMAVGYGQTILRRIARDHGNPMVVTIWQLLGAGAACLFVLLFFESWLDTRGIMEVPSVKVWLLIIYLAVFVSAGTFALNNYGLRYIAAGHTSLYYVLMAPLGVPFSYYLLGESVSVADLFAIVLVMAGVAAPTVAQVFQRARIHRRALK